MRSIKKRSKRLKDTQCPQACGHWVSTGQFEIKKRRTSIHRGGALQTEPTCVSNWQFQWIQARPSPETQRE